VNPIAQLAAQGRARSAELAPFSPPAAEAFLRAAAEFEGALDSFEREVLTLKQSAQWSGYSERRLRELTAKGELPNVVKRGRPCTIDRISPASRGGPNALDTTRRKTLGVRFNARQDSGASVKSRHQAPRLAPGSNSPATAR
jgi:hypothetical protein